MQLSTPRIVHRPCEQFTFILRLTGYLSYHTVVIDFVRKNRIRRRRGTQEGTQNMRYNVPVHKSGLYLLCIVPKPSMDSFSTPVEGGNWDVKGQTSFRSIKGPVGNT